jgi:hypothetical protein
MNQANNRVRRQWWEANEAKKWGALNYAHLDIQPCVFVEITEGPRREDRQWLRALLDSGSTGNVVYSKALSEEYESFSGCRPKRTTWETGGGNFYTTHDIELTIKFPEMSTTRQCQGIFKVKKGHPGRYEMIIGRRTMADWKFKIDFSEAKINWQGVSIDMPKQPITKDDVQHYNLQFETPTVIREATARQVRILDATYEKAHLPDCIPKTINASQQRRLLSLLQHHESLFDGKLGTLRGIPPVDIELIATAKPVSRRPYSIPISLYPTAKKEVQRLVQIGVLGTGIPSEWGFPSMIIPKKNGEVRFVTDFRMLNPFVI